MIRELIELRTELRPIREKVIIHMGTLEGQGEIFESYKKLITPILDAYECISKVLSNNDNEICKREKQGSRCVNCNE